MPFITGFLGYLLGISRDKNKTIFDKKLEIYSSIIAELQKHKYIVNQINSDDLISLFAPARLLASVKLEKKLRDCYTNIHDYWKKEDSEQLKLLSVITEDCMEIEQLMRKELNPGNAGRIYAAKQIQKHIKGSVIAPIKTLTKKSDSQ